MGPIEEFCGAVLGIVVLADIFLLILYARANKTIISTPLAHSAWRGFVGISKLFGRWREYLLAFSGPVILVMVLAVWALLLALAIALIVQPNLGTGIRATQGRTPMDFITALYVGGISLSFIGASDFSPQSAFFRVFYLLTSLLGVSLVSLEVTFLMQLYTSLQERNVLGLKAHVLSSETGDAAEVIARLGPQGQFEEGYQILADWADKTTQVRESHHFYPMLFYFRFRQPYYSVSRTALTALDTITLIRSALDDEEYGWFKQSAPVDHLWRGTLMEMKTLAQTFLPKVVIDVPPDEQTRRRWQRRYEAGVERLRRAGIKTTTSGLEKYVSLRRQWDRYITLLAPQFAYDMDEIDPALAKVK